MGIFPHLRPPKIFFQKSGSVTFVPLWCTNFMQKIRKILRAVSEIFKDGRTDYYYGLRTDMGDYIGPLSGKPGVQNVNVSLEKVKLRIKRISNCSTKIYSH